MGRVESNRAFPESLIIRSEVQAVVLGEYVSGHTPIHPRRCPFPQKPLDTICRSGFLRASGAGNARPSR